MQEEQSLLNVGAGDATIAALLLAHQIVGKPIRDDIKNYDMANKDPASFNRAQINTLNDTFLNAVKKVNPDFDPEKQMAAIPVGKDYANYPGAMSKSTNRTPETFTVRFGPGADGAVYAHELGHVLSQNTPGHRQINDARHFMTNNPSLRKMMDSAQQLEMISPGTKQFLKNNVTPRKMYSSMLGLAPGAVAGMIDGDDDMGASLALGLGLAAPVLADEGIASLNALKMMKDSGMPATNKQKRRLAAAFSSYLAVPLTAAATGNVIGNFFD